MSYVLAKAEYIEVDTNYNENTDLPYLLNITAFNYTVIKCILIAVARIHRNKEDSEYFMPVTLKQFLSNVNMQDHKEFGVGKALKGIVMDWSDTKRS